MNFEKNNLEAKQDSNKLVEMKRLFVKCFEAQKIEDGDILPVGGHNHLSGKLDIEIMVNTKDFEQFVDETYELFNGYNLSALRKSLDRYEIDISEKTYAMLIAFTKNFEKQYSDALTAEEQERLGCYKEKNYRPKLSDLFDRRLVMCAEIATLAQIYLQKGNISSTYFHGAVLWNINDEFSDTHSFIIIREGGKLYIYDPANPIENTGSGTLPALYTVEADFDKEMAKGEIKFVTAENALTKKKVYFGNDDGNVIPEKHIV